MLQPPSAPSVDALYVGTGAEGLSRAADRLTVRRVTTAGDALAALDADSSIDCVVSDASLPEIDGLAFFRAVRDLREDLPFVLVVGPEADVPVGDALDAGVTDCVRVTPDTADTDLLAHRIDEAVASHRTERRLRTERSQHRQLFADAPVMYVAFRRVDDEPVVEDCNDRFLDRLGYERDDILGRSVWDIYADESMAHAVDGFDSGRQGTFGQQERTLVAADGERVDTLFRASPRLDATGDVIGTLGLYVDITAQKRRERTFERLHDATRSLLRAGRSARVAEIITDAVRDVLGYPTNLVRLVDGDELHPVAITDEAERRLGERPVYRIGEGTAGRAFADGETLVYDDVRTVDDDYDRRTARASMFVPIGDHGVLSVGDTEVGTFDRLDRHLAEVFAANAATALTLLDRTRDLERQNERLDEFASVVSHDLRTPLTVVDGSLELACERHDDEDLDRAARSLDRAFDLIEELLALARTEASHDRRPIDLSTVAEACWRTADTGDATLVVEDDVAVRADEARLLRLLENLFRNAVEHGSTGRRPEADDSAEHGSVADLTVTVGPLPDGFYVADDGPGLPDDGDVFEAGYTTDPAGTGLGLAIVDRIAGEHGWSADAIEADDGGARFEFRN
jgi:PAS domain S-box-containing protein